METWWYYKERLVLIWGWKFRAGSRIWCRSTRPSWGWHINHWDLYLLRDLGYMGDRVHVWKIGMSDKTKATT